MLMYLNNLFAGYYFIDREDNQFVKIMEFLRTGVIKEGEDKEFKKECEFWKIDLSNEGGK